MNPATVSAGSIQEKVWNEKNGIREVTSLQAYDLWKNNRESIKIIDCRTVEEYMAGHPEMAVNIPVEIRVDGSVVNNSGFESEIKKTVSDSDTILVICRTGRRSLAASIRILKEGFKNVMNISDGFEGKKPDFFSESNAGKGWKKSGLPWKKGSDAKTP